MNSDRTPDNPRLEQLRGMLKEEPGDVFLLYAIMLERKKSGEFAAAVEDGRQLLDLHPDHAPTRYQLALLCQDLGRSTEAIDHCMRGRALAVRQNDAKAANEFRELEQLLREGE